jgi:hypothetical protein
MEDDLNKISNGRRPQFCFRQPEKPISGMQPYFDPLDEIWKMTSIFLKMEDALKLFSNGR